MILKIINLYKTFIINKKHYPVLTKINVEIPEGQILGLIGETGSGKTTLLKIMNNLEQPDKREDTQIIKKFNYLESSTIWQNLNLLSNLNVFDNIALPLKIRKYPKEQIKHKVLEVINFVGLSNFIYSYPKQLSGGQKQRTAIARAVVYEPKIIFCDEPTSSLDEKVSQNILEIFHQINKIKKTTIIIISHNSSIIKSLCNSVVILNKNKIEKIIDLKPSYNFKSISYQDFFLQK
ncbi:MAG: ATP-binding cassette domain-containing protein [Phytoplasma sp.]|uniref:ATP-binding cassette domain-containing protein n=1 Tax=Phytoplasma sp. TaxID=2155 RepID=UPI002B405EEF|nr:ATP-binding cassette domain-containing protein [Phytoplasma sp.]WRH06678.1 MAG: ATP-binding cassette domain-containing protein [Phytoplasma sp.]